MIRSLSILAILVLSSQSHAGVSIEESSGKISVNVSGGDGYSGSSGSSGTWHGDSGRDGSNGSDGGDAGRIVMQMGYADASKNQVSIQIDARSAGGERRTLKKTYNVSDLKSISLIGLGGDGGRGGDGGSGADGDSGRDGQGGCNPTNGENGSNGGDGGNGGYGGDGGRGGVIQVEVPADQSELLLFVTSKTAPGSGASGGDGGRAGSGGSGGRGGDGHCFNPETKKVEPVADGSRGWDGSSGRSGSGGSGGRDGTEGSKAYTLKSAAGDQSYRDSFNLEIGGVKAIDDNEDGILEPGEDLHVLSMTISNTGPMPTTANQALKIIVGDNRYFVLRNSPAIAINETIPGRGSKVLTFQKGELSLQTKKENALVGQHASLATRFRINQIGRDESSDSSMGVSRPLNLSSAAESVDSYFGSAKNISFSLKNSSKKDLGESAGRLIEAEFTWVSKDVNGADVAVTLKDGRHFTLEKPFVVSDLAVAAKSTLAVPVAMLIKNPKNNLKASGTLKVALRLKDLTMPGQEAIDGSQTALRLAYDLRPVTISRSFETSQMSASCTFPGSLIKTWTLSAVGLSKAKNSEKMSFQITTGTFLAKSQSPVMTISAHEFAEFYRSMNGTPSASTIVSFMNKLGASASRGLERKWQFSGCKIAQ